MVVKETVNNCDVHGPGVIFLSFFFSHSGQDTKRCPPGIKGKTTEIIIIIDQRCSDDGCFPSDRRYSGRQGKSLQTLHVNVGERYGWRYLRNV